MVSFLQASYVAMNEDISAREHRKICHFVADIYISMTDLYAER